MGSNTSCFIESNKFGYANIRKPSLDFQAILKVYEQVGECVCVCEREGERRRGWWRSD